jgi:two-component system heavy metal sensor histidine kinase CusS
MLSRSADADGGGLHWRSPLGGKSIAAHIARLYTLSAVILLAIVVGLLYWVETASLEWDDVYFLTDKVHELRQAMGNDTVDSNLLTQKVKVEGGLHTPGQHFIFYFRILDEGGRVLSETPDMKKIVPVGLFSPPTDNGEMHRQAELKTGTDGRAYLLVSAWGETGTGSGKPLRRVIQAALDNTDEKALISRYQGVSLVLVILGALLSAGTGFLVARSGLRPLGDIARVAEQITPSRLNQRVGPERWPQELTTLAAAFDRMLDRLEESHTRLAQFAADIAHELRTALHAVTVQVEFALSKERAPHEYRSILEPALEELQALARTIDGLLFLARAENPKTDVERRWFDARRELEAVCEFHEALAEDRGVTMTCRGQAHLHADPLLIRRAATNLVSNALRHTPSGGHIVLSLELAQDNAVLLSVSDTGCGIRREDLPRVCERLFCAAQGTARCAEGAGLGLAIVKSIAELHDGTASVDSRPGQGTTVVLRFPAQALATA